MISDTKQLCESISQVPKDHCSEHNPKLHQEVIQCETVVRQMEICTKENQIKYTNRLKEISRSVRQNYRKTFIHEFYSDLSNNNIKNNLNNNINNNLIINIEEELQLQEISHILGTEGVKGISLFHGLDWIVEAIDLHRNKYPMVKSYFDIIHKAMNDIDLYYGEPFNWAKHFQEHQELTIIPGNWKSSEFMGHSVSIALMGNRLIYTNTGDQYQSNFNSQPGTFICFIKDSKLITQEFITNCFKDKDSLNTPNDTKTFLENLLSVIDTSKDVIYIPSKAQKRDNCTVSNLKKNMKGILACLWSMEKYKDLTYEHISEGIKETASIYKHFTNTSLRENVLNKFIKLCQMHNESSSLYPKLTSLLRSYIFQHYKTQEKPKTLIQQQEKRFQDIVRIRKLHKAMPDYYKKHCPSREEIFGAQLGGHKGPPLRCLK